MQGDVRRPARDAPVGGRDAHPTPRTSLAVGATDQYVLATRLRRGTYFRHSLLADFKSVRRCELTRGDKRRMKDPGFAAVPNEPDLPRKGQWNLAVGRVHPHRGVNEHPRWCSASMRHGVAREFSQEKDARRGWSPAVPCDV
jgi:hypothetical protein